MRTLLLAILVVEAALGLSIMRARRFREIAESHLAILEESLAYRYACLGPFFREFTWHCEMQQKYEYAEDHPWLPVFPDPPKPELYGKAAIPSEPGRPFAASTLVEDDDPSRPLPPLPVTIR
jgi:hypothetical protein